MSAPAVTRTPQEMADEAAAILTRVREADWPPAREAQWAIGWAYADAAEAHGVYALVLNDWMDPFKVGAPDMGWWDDPKASALEYAADQALQCAQAAAKRLAEYQRREGAALLAGEGES